jgi:hypothetical protein
MSFQDELLTRGPFGVCFDEITTLCEYHHFHRFSVSTVRFFRARYPERPIKIDGYVYVYETSAAGPRVSDGRVTRIIQVDIASPNSSRVVEEGKAAVKRVWTGLIKQAIALERGDA